MAKECDTNGNAKVGQLLGTRAVAILVTIVTLPAPVIGGLLYLVWNDITSEVKSVDQSIDSLDESILIHTREPGHAVVMQQVRQSVDTMTSLAKSAEANAKATQVNAEAIRELDHNGQMFRQEIRFYLNAQKAHNDMVEAYMKERREERRDNP